VSLDHHDHDHAAHAGAKYDHDHEAHGDHQGHSHDVRDVPSERLRAALVLTVGFLIVEVVGGYLTHSLALLSDAGHMLADSGALAIALAARVVGRRPRSALRTFGYRRAEVIAALVNALVLLGGAIAIVVEAIERWRTPRPVHGLAMLVIAVIGLLVNLCSAWILSRGREGHDTNTRAALAHVMSDALGSMGAITAAVLVITLRWTRADAVISLGIAGLVALASVQLLRQAGHVLMEGVPHGLSMKDVAETVMATDGVHSMHDLHAWRIADGFDAAMVHVVVSDEHDAVMVAERVACRIREVHKIAHVTVQPERRDSKCRECEPNRAV
jgi:cobalt-zinc-cadmium efflux system protein